MNRRCIALITVLLCSLPAGAGVFKWVDAQGQVHYGDRPPASVSGQAEEVTHSGVPAALVERLRGLDTAFVITRVTGNLEVASVCGLFNHEQVDEPSFPYAVEKSRLGKVKQGYHNSYSPTDDVDYGSNRGTGNGANGGKCPPRDKDRGDRLQRIYEIRFSPEAVSAYRATGN